MKCASRVQKIVLVPFVFRAELGVTRAKLLEMRRATRCARCFSSTFIPVRSSNYNYIFARDTKGSSRTIKRKNDFS